MGKGFPLVLTSNPTISHFQIEMRVRSPFSAARSCAIWSLVFHVLILSSRNRPFLYHLVQERHKRRPHHFRERSDLSCFKLDLLLNENTLLFPLKLGHPLTATYHLTKKACSAPRQAQEMGEMKTERDPIFERTLERDGVSLY